MPGEQVFVVVVLGEPAVVVVVVLDEQAVVVVVVPDGLLALVADASAGPVAVGARPVAGTAAGRTYWEAGAVRGGGRPPVRGPVGSVRVAVGGATHTQPPMGGAGFLRLSEPQSRCAVERSESERCETAVREGQVQGGVRSVSSAVSCCLAVAVKEEVEQQ